MNNLIKKSTLLTISLTSLILIFAAGLTSAWAQASTDYFVNVRDFGAIGDGVADDTAPIQAAIDSLYVNSLGGGTVYFPPGRYRVTGSSSGDTYQGVAMKNGIYLRNVNTSATAPTYGGRNNRVTLRGAGKSSVIYGDSNNLIILRISTSFATVKDLVIEGSTAYGQFGTRQVGIALVPDNMQETGTKGATMYNSLENIHISYTQEGFLLACGPRSSMCYRNSFSHISLSNMVRGVYLHSGSDPTSPIFNRNYFENITMDSMNIGFHIEAGDTNTCMHCTMSNITLTGSGAPRSVPTGLVIEVTDVYGTWGNAANVFYNLKFENSRRDIENNHYRTEIYSTNATQPGHDNVWNVDPAVLTSAGGNHFNYTGLNVGKRDVVVDAKVILGLHSTDRGFLPPRMTTSQRDAMGSVPEGLMIYNLSTKTLNLYSNGAWRAFQAN